jgi:HK97 family phage prohead protease
MTTIEPREIRKTNLCREVTFRAVGADPQGDGLSIEGYGAVFNSVTTIDSFEGQFEETIIPGAFKKSLREAALKMQYDHGRHPLLGSLPLGNWTTAEEDEHGLHLIGRLHDNWITEPFRDAIRSGSVTGMSFRFSVVRDDWTDKDGKKLGEGELQEMLWYGGGDRGPLLRTLKEVRVSEAGPVTWPAYQDTEVGVRSGVLTIDLANLHTAPVRRELSRALFLADRAVTEPQATAEPAAEHPTPQGPQRTEESAAGEHSSITAARRRRMSAKLASVRSAASR